MNVDLHKYITNKMEEYHIENDDFYLEITKFFVSNKWFGISPVVEDGKVYVDELLIRKIEPKINEYCSMTNASIYTKIEYLYEKMEKILPRTKALLQKFSNKVSLDENSEYYLIDFLLIFLPGELNESSDAEISTLMSDAYDELPKVYSHILAEFINWTKNNTKTIYQGTYFMNKYSSTNNQAYDEDIYLEIMFNLFNAEYIEEKKMIQNAARSKNYTDTWLFLSLHFLCALRNTDLVLLPHPKLIDTPENTLKKIEEGSFEDSEAISVLYSVLWYLESIGMVPNKTKSTSNVPNVKLHIPTSVEVLMGTLFAAAEAHFELTEDDKTKPYIRIITTYEQISRYMGEEIGDLFLETNFRTRAANKSYMQMIFMLTDSVLDEYDEFNTKGYMLAALARSHKGSYGDFAKTTSIYLKDAKMNGYTPEFVAKELFERGVLSMIPSMLLNMIMGKEFEGMTVSNQTKLIKELDLSPLEIEKSVLLMQSNIKKSVSIVKGLFENYSKGELINILHKIGNGEAVSKNNNCLCLATAMGKICPHDEMRNCLGCEYELSTKTTMLLMAKEYKRLKILHKTTDNPIEKEKCKALASNIVIPTIDEMLSFIENNYGEEALKIYEKVISEVA